MTYKYVNDGSNKSLISEDPKMDFKRCVKIFKKISLIDGLENEPNFFSCRGDKCRRGLDISMEHWCTACHGYPEDPEEVWGRLYNPFEPPKEYIKSEEIIKEI